MQSSKFNVYTLWSAESSKSIVEVELGTSTSTSIYNTEAGWAQARHKHRHKHKYIQQYTSRVGTGKAHPQTPTHNHSSAPFGTKHTMTLMLIAS